MMFFRRLYHLRRFSRQQWSSPEEIRELQDLKLNQMVRHCYRYVPFYRRKWKELGISPDDIKCQDDLRKLPIIDKEEVNRNIADFHPVDKDSSNYITKTTTGSSGYPLMIQFDRESWDILGGVFARALFAIGYRPWDKFAYVEFTPYKETSFYNRLGFMKKHHIPAYTSKENQLRSLIEINPKYLFVQPSIIYPLTKTIQERQIDNLKLKAVISKAEMLAEKDAEFLKEVLRCDIFEHYGSAEFLRMAWECKSHSGLHIEADSMIMEFMKNGESVDSGEKGKIVVTGLINRATPLIRYDIDDVGSLSEEPCLCGRGLPLMKVLEGRKDDYIVLPSGRLVGPRILIGNLNKVFIGNEEIFRIKITQEKKDRILLYIVENKKLSDVTIERCKELMDEVFQEPVEILIKVVDELPKSGRGKIRPVESKVILRKDIF